MQQPLIILFLLLLLIIPVSAGCNPCDLYNKAEENFYSQKYEQAIPTYLEALDLADIENYQDSNFYQQAWWAIGSSYDHLKKYEKAIEAYKTAMRYSGIMTNADFLSSIALDYDFIAINMEKELPKNPTYEQYNDLAKAFGTASDAWKTANEYPERLKVISEKEKYYLNLAKEAEIPKIEVTQTPMPTLKLENPVSSPVTHQTGSLSFITNPPGAQITLDGSLQGGQTPLTLSDIKAGSHSFTFSKSGYLDVSMTIPVIADEKSEFSISLSPDSAKVTSATSDSDVNQKISIEQSNGEDLIIKDISIVYYKSDSNELSTDLTIRNIGTAPTTRFSVTYFLSPEQIQDLFMDPEGKEIILGRDEINTLDAGESRQSSTIKTFSVYDVKPGIYWFGVFVDSQNKISETDEENNVLYWDEQVKI